MAAVSPGDAGGLRGGIGKLLPPGGVHPVLVRVNEKAHQPPWEMTSYCLPTACDNERYPRCAKDWNPEPDDESHNEPEHEHNNEVEHASFEKVPEREPDEKPQLSRRVRIT